MISFTKLGLLGTIASRCLFLEGEYFMKKFILLFILVLLTIANVFTLSSCNTTQSSDSSQSSICQH